MNDIVKLPTCDDIKSDYCGLARYAAYKEDAVRAWNKMNAPCPRCAELEAEVEMLRGEIKRLRDDHGEGYINWQWTL